MSMTPQNPNFKSVVRSFWERPEGTAGKIVLVAGALGVAGVALFYWGLILPFLIGVAGNTIQLALLIGVLGVLTSPLWSSRVRLLTTTAFQLSMRWATNFFIETDPIGILRNNVLDMRKQVQVFDDAITKLSGARENLDADIRSNEQTIRTNKAMADKASSEITKRQALVRTPEDQLLVDRLSLQRQGYFSAAGLAKRSIDTETPLKLQADKMYTQLVRIRELASFKVDSLTQQADMLEKQRRVILSGQRALGAANKILKGDPAQLAMIEQTVDYLNTEANDTIGLMNDFNRWSEKYLLDMDIQNGAAADEAEKMFVQMEKKLSAPADLPIITAIPDGEGGFTTPSLPSSTNDYTKFLK